MLRKRLYVGSFPIYVHEIFIGLKKCLFDDRSLSYCSVIANRQICLATTNTKLRQCTCTSTFDQRPQYRRAVFDLFLTSRVSTTTCRFCANLSQSIWLSGMAAIPFRHLPRISFETQNLPAQMTRLFAHTSSISICLITETKTELNVACERAYS